MKLVVDASVTVKWIVPDRAGETHIEQARSVVAMLDRPDCELFAPPHWMAEVLAVIARIQPTHIDDAIRLFHDARPIIVDSLATLRFAAKLSVDLDHHLFDTLYHAVAMEVGATLITADERYFAKAMSLGSIIMLVDFRAPDQTRNVP